MHSCFPGATVHVCPVTGQQGRALQANSELNYILAHLDTLSTAVECHQDAESKGFRKYLTLLMKKCPGCIITFQNQKNKANII